MMRAVVQRSYGSAETLQLGEMARPVAGPGQVLLEVHAAGVDRGTWHLMTGLPYLMRVVGFGLTGRSTRFPGSTSPAASWRSARTSTASASATRSSASPTARTRSTPSPRRTSSPTSRRRSASSRPRGLGLGHHGAPGPDRESAGSSRPARARDRRLRRRGQLRRPDRQGAGSPGHRRGQRAQGRPRAFARRRCRHRLRRGATTSTGRRATT